MRGSTAAVLIAILLALGGAACQTPRSAGESSTAVAPPTALPPITPTKPPASIGMVERFGWQTVEQMRDAFVAGDAPAFLSKVSRGFYRGYANLETALGKTFAGRPQVELVIAIREVTADEDKVNALVRWNRTITPREGPAQLLSGETQLVFLKTEGALRLIDYRKGSLFGLSGF